MKKTKTSTLSTIILIILAVVYFYLENTNDSTVPSPSTEMSASSKAHTTVHDYFEQRVSGRMVSITAKVKRLLSDDTHKPRHQRFIIKLDTGITVLIAHNIDLAPRVSDLQEGDEVTITGQYEWNERGGVIHWTHHDPKKRRDGGHIEHKGIVYQ